jgi:OOP family OmpA-OmpF porin
MRRRWVGLALIALAALAVLAAVMHMRTSGFWPAESGKQAERPADAGQPASGDGGTAKLSPPAQEPPTFRAERNGERIVVSGLVSGEEARSALLEEARQAGPNIIVADELKTSGKASSRLDAAASFALRHLARLPAGAIVIRDGTIVLSGQAPDPETYNGIAAAAQTAPDGFRLDIAGLIPPVVRPYTWAATNTETALTIWGHIPSEAARKALAAATHALLPEKEVVERLQPASGVPSGLDFEAAVRFALTQLAQLRWGTAELADKTLNLSGDVTDRDTLAGVRAALQGSLPAGLQAGSVAITLSRPSPYTFSARREAGTLVLTGYYPDPETRAALHQLIRERFFSEQVIDKLRAAEGAPPNYLSGVSFGLEHLARLASGEVAVSGTSLRLNGEALYEQTAEQTVRTVQAMSVRGWTGKAEVRTRRPEKADAAQFRSPPP